MPLHEMRGSREDTAARTPRVCLLTETFYPVVGGGETHARLLAQHLNCLGMSSFVLTRRSDRRLPRTESVDGTKTYRVPPAGMKRLGKYAMVPFVLFELIRRRREYDLVLVCGFRVLGVPAVIAARLLGKSCVLRAEAQGEMSGGYASAYKKLPLAVGALFRTWINLRNRILKRADAFVSISNPIAEEFAECGVDVDRILELPNGIDTERFRPVDAGTRRLLREKLGLPVEKITAIYCGKLNRGKGLEHLLQAWETVIACRKDAYLVLVGSGGGQSLSCEDDLRRLVHARDLGSTVIFTGSVQNSREHLQASDIFILPSENEALPMSLLEAMSCGLPSIASRVGGIPQVVTHLENGILVEPADPDGLAREILGLLHRPSLAESLSANARRTVCERYAIGPVSARYFQLFSCLSSRRVSSRPRGGETS